MAWCEDHGILRLPSCAECRELDYPVRIAALEAENAELKETRAAITGTATAIVAKMEAENARLKASAESWCELERVARARIQELEATAEVERRNAREVERLRSRIAGWRSGDCHCPESDPGDLCQDCDMATEEVG